MRRAVVVLCCTGAIVCLQARPAAAFNPAGPLCSAAGWISGIAGKACKAVADAPKIVGAGKKLLSGHPGAAAKALFGGASKTSLAVGLGAMGAWVLVGAKVAMHKTATLIGRTTDPQLQSTWFSGAYWRMAGIAAVLTLPFLFAAAIQALVRSDLTLLLRAALGYLPLAFLAVSIAAPVTMLLLTVSDQMSAAISASAGHDGVAALDKAGLIIGGLSTLDGSPFLAFVVGLFAVAGAVVLWLELLMREAAVYVVVLMLPLAFAALVWPARRIWALRTVEVLVALILSKFAVVAVLTLAAAAIGHSFWSQAPTAMIGGAALVILGAFAPWALLRLVPLAEIASSTAGTLRGSFSHARQGGQVADVAAKQIAEAVGAGTGDPAPVRAGARDAALDQRQRLDEQAVAVAGVSRNGSDPAAASEDPGVGATAVHEVTEPSAEPATEPPTEPQAPPNSDLPEIFRMADGTWREVVLGYEGMSQPPVDPVEDTPAAEDRRPEADLSPRPEDDPL